MSNHRRGWIFALAVAAVAAGLVAYKELGARPGPAATQVAAAGAGTVVLFADPGEAEVSCGCGEIIRLVRAAATRGVVVREVAPGSDTALERQHRVTVAPTVLVLDAGGRAVARHEGEAEETIAKIRGELDRLATAVR